MRKSFKDNDSYFKFINKMKDNIKILEVRIHEKIKIIYEVN